MRMDYFHEESVSKAGATARGALYFACYGGMIIFGILALQGLMALMGGNLNLISVAITLICGAAAYGMYILRNNQNIEYDYTFTNGMLDIAKVINSNKRKKLLSADIKEFEIIAPTSDAGFERMLNHKAIVKKYNCFLNKGKGLYYGIFVLEGQKSMLVFEPSEKMLSIFKKFNPKGVKL